MARSSVDWYASEVLRGNVSGFPTLRLIRMYPPVVRAILQWLPAMEGTERDYSVIADFGSHYDPDRVRLEIGFQVNDQDQRERVRRIHGDGGFGDVRERYRAAPIDLQPWLLPGAEASRMESPVVTQRLQEVMGLRREVLMVRHVEPLLTELRQWPTPQLEAFLWRERS